MHLMHERPDLIATRDDEGRSPLMVALYHGNRRVAEELRRRMVELDQFEASASGDVERLAALVTDQSTANAWSSDGFTALHLASFFGQPEAVRLLIRRGADTELPATNSEFARGARPLHSAVAAGSSTTAALLLEAGADPDAVQHGGFTPILEAAQAGNADIVELLLRHGADPTARLDDGTSASELALRAGNDALAERLESVVATISLTARPERE